MQNTIKMNGTSFDDFVKGILNKKAAAAKAVKTAEKEEDEAESSGQPEAEAKLVNTPEKEEGSVKGKGKSEKCEGETSGQPQAEAKLVNHPKVQAKTKKTVKKAEEVEVEVEVEEEEEKEEEKEEKEAKTISFLKIAKLNSKTKTMLRTYWAQLYPAEYADAMVAEE